MKNALRMVGIVIGGGLVASVISWPSLVLSIAVCLVIGFVSEWATSDVK